MSKDMKDSITPAEKATFAMRSKLLLNALSLYSDDINELEQVLVKFFNEKPHLDQLEILTIVLYATDIYNVTRLSNLSGIDLIREINRKTSRVVEP